MQKIIGFIRCFKKDLVKKKKIHLFFESQKSKKKKYFKKILF